MLSRAIQRCLLVLLIIGMIGLITACGGEEKNKETITITTNDELIAAEPTPDSVTVLTDMMDKITVVLYFANDQGYLVAEQRDIPKVDGLARVTMQELAKGSQGGMGLLPTLPVGTQLRDINIRDGLCIVDFTGEIKENHAGGSIGELLTVYSIVNTLSQFASVQEVQILVNGQFVETLAGHVEINQPLSRDDSVIASH